MSKPTLALSRYRNRDGLAAAIFLTPNLLGFLLFTSMPLLASLALTFFDWDFITTPHFVGLGNFQNLLGFTYTDGQFKANDANFYYYCYNTLFLMLGLPLNVAGSLFLASLLNRELKGTGVFKTLLFLPNFTAGIATFILWRWMYNPDFGLLNAYLENGLFPVWNHTIGALLHSLTGSDAMILLKGPRWLSSVTWAKPALVIMSLWIAAGGFNMILYLAALQGVPQSLYEAADIDGVNSWQRFVYITWPSIRHTTFFVITMGVIGGLQGGFQQAYVMTGGGPAGSTMTIGYYIYQQAYQWQNIGYATAIAWCLFVVVLVITLLNWRRQKQYD